MKLDRVAMSQLRKYNNFSQNRPLAFSFYMSMNLFMCLFPSPPTSPEPLDWRLLVGERIANIGIPVGFFFFFAVSMICLVWHFFGFRVIANQPNVHTEGASRGTFCSCGPFMTCDRWRVSRDTLCKTCDMWNLTPDTWQMTCFYDKQIHMWSHVK